jgi:hypothetical protein
MEQAPESGPVDVEVVSLTEMIGAGTKSFETLGPGPALCTEADQVLEDHRAGKTAPPGL